jgi:hypothetical protein
LRRPAGTGRKTPQLICNPTRIVNIVNLRYDSAKSQACKNLCDFAIIWNMAKLHVCFGDVNRETERLWIKEI